MQTSAAAAIIRRRRAMATAVLYSPRVALQGGELRGATHSSTVPEQCKLVRNKFGLVLGLRECCGREPVTFVAARRRPEALKPNDADAEPARLIRALDASTRGLWSVYDSYELLARAGLLKS